MSQLPTPSSNTPPSATQPKRRGWLIWLLGGIAAFAVLCVTLVAIGGFFLLRAAKDQAAFVQARNGRPIYDSHANAKQDIARALLQARAEHKLVLLDFGADWCPDCVVLARLFDDPTVKPFLDAHYVVARIYVGRWDANLGVSKQYGDPITQGIPAVVVLAPDGHIVASTRGGELANARTATKQDILAFLQQWAALK